MVVELKPETEALILQDIQTGAYGSAREFVEHAVALLHEREEWLAENRAEITSRIELGYASAQRGELIDGDQLPARMAARKQAWLAQQRDGK